MECRAAPLGPATRSAASSAQSEAVDDFAVGSSLQSASFRLTCRGDRLPWEEMPQSGSPTNSNNPPQKNMWNGMAFAPIRARFSLPPHGSRPWWPPPGFRTSRSPCHNNGRLERTVFHARGVSPWMYLVFFLCQGMQAFCTAFSFRCYKSQILDR